MFSEKRVSALPVVDESGMICFLCSLLKISFLKKVKQMKQRQAEVKNFLKRVMQNSLINIYSKL